MPNSEQRPAWDKGPWHESDDVDRVVRNAFWRIVGYTCAGIAVALVIWAIVWAIGVGTSGVKGKGDVIRQNNDATNRVFAQGHFQTLYGNIKTYQNQLPGARDDVKAGDDPNAKTNFRGLYNTCVDAVEQYNADSNKVLEKDWKDPDLPKTLDPVAMCGDPDPTK